MDIAYKVYSVLPVELIFVGRRLSITQQQFLQDRLQPQQLSVLLFVRDSGFAGQIEQDLENFAR